MFCCGDFVGEWNTGKQATAVLVSLAKVVANDSCEVLLCKKWRFGFEH